MVVYALSPAFRWGIGAAPDNPSDPRTTAILPMKADSSSESGRQFIWRLSTSRPSRLSHPIRQVAPVLQTRRRNNSTLLNKISASCPWYSPDIHQRYVRKRSTNRPEHGFPIWVSFHHEFYILHRMALFPCHPRIYLQHIIYLLGATTTISLYP